MSQPHPQTDNAITESVELRWFFHGQLPGLLLQRFKDFAAFRKFEISKESRADYYLKNKRETVGIKLRKDGDEKDIELKFLKASAPHDESNVSGQVERWRKWKFPAAKFNFRNERSVLETEWIAVDKTRYSMDIPALSSKSKKEGCSFELTSISSSYGSFWTIGFEAFSDSGNEEGNFTHAVNLTNLDFFGNDLQVIDGGQQLMQVHQQRVRFSKDNSFNYPKFISEKMLK
jgi:hypothetical protein